MAYRNLTIEDAVYFNTCGISVICDGDMLKFIFESENLE